MHHVTLAKVGGQRATDCQWSAGLTENKWCLVNKLNYCFNSCSLIQFCPGEESFTGEQRSEGKESERGRGGEAADDGTETRVLSPHKDIPWRLRLHWRRVTALTTLIISQDHVTSPPFVSQLNVIKLCWIELSWATKPTPRHQPRDNKQETDMNFINWYTD